MNVKTGPENRDSGQGNNTQKLMATGVVYPKRGCALSREVRRGMAIQSSEGCEVGKVAAVLLNSADHRVTHILLGRLPGQNGYWLVPVEWIDDVCEEVVHLSIPMVAAENLPRWQSG